MHSEKAVLDIEGSARRRRWGILSALLLLAAALRVYNLSHGWGAHPDERHMVMVAEKLSWTSLNPQSFAYGSFPYYLLWLVSSALGMIYGWLQSYDGLFMVGRSICAAFGLLGIWFAYLLGRRTSGLESVGLLAAAFLALNVFHLQLSRFYTVDVVLATVCSAALLVALALADRWSLRLALGGGALLGLAAATKISALALLPAFFTAWILFCLRERAFFSPGIIGKGIVLLLTALITFAIAEPYAFLDSASFLKDIREQTGMVKGLWRPPYIIQYAGTAPYFYHLKQLWHYTMGWPLALSVFAGMALALFRQIRQPRSAEIVLLVFVLGTFAAIGGQQVKFPRYLLPLYAPLFVFASQFLLQIAGVGRMQRDEQGLRRPDGPALTGRFAPLLERLKTYSRMFRLTAAAIGLFVVGLAVYQIFLRGSVPEQASTVPDFLDEPDQDEAPLDMFSGGRGQRLGRFQTARDLSVCASGEVVVPDSNNHRIQVFDAQGGYLRHWGSKGDGPGQFNEPHAAVCAPDGTIFVLDSWNGRVQSFSPDGRLIAILNTEGGMFGPRAMALKSGLLYIVDSGHAQIVVMDTSGSVQNIFGERGSGAAQFLEPVGIAVDSQNRIWVSDSGNNRLQLLTSEGALVRQVSVPGWSGGTLKEAYLETDRDDNLYLADPVSGNLLRLRAGAEEFEILLAAHPNMRGLALRETDFLVTADNQVLSFPR